MDTLKILTTPVLIRLPFSTRDQSKHTRKTVPFAKMSESKRLVVDLHTRILIILHFTRRAHNTTKHNRMRSTRINVSTHKNGEHPTIERNIHMSNIEYLVQQQTQQYE